MKRKCNTKTLATVAKVLVAILTVFIMGVFGVSCYRELYSEVSEEEYKIYEEIAQEAMQKQGIPENTEIIIQKESSDIFERCFGKVIATSNKIERRNEKSNKIVALIFIMVMCEIFAMMLIRSIFFTVGLICTGINAIINIMKNKHKKKEKDE